MAESMAGFVIADFADKGGFSAEARQTDHRIRRRPARHDGRRTHGFIQCGGLGFVDQHHAALVKSVTDEKIVFGPGDHIDNRIADRDNVINSVCSHPGALLIADLVGLGPDQINPLPCAPAPLRQSSSSWRNLLRRGRRSSAPACSQSPLPPGSRRRYRS